MIETQPACKFSPGQAPLKALGILTLRKDWMKKVLSLIPIIYLRNQRLARISHMAKLTEQIHNRARVKFRQPIFSTQFRTHSGVLMNRGPPCGAPQWPLSVLAEGAVNRRNGAAYSSALLLLHDPGKKQTSSCFITTSHNNYKD